MTAPARAPPPHARQPALHPAIRTRVPHGLGRRDLRRLPHLTPVCARPIRQRDRAQNHDQPDRCHSLDGLLDRIARRGPISDSAREPVWLQLCVPTTGAFGSSRLVVRCWSIGAGHDDFALSAMGSLTQPDIPGGASRLRCRRGCSTIRWVIVAMASGCVEQPASSPGRDDSGWVVEIE
jgi:hypothetical protein